MYQFIHVVGQQGVGKSQVIVALAAAYQARGLYALARTLLSTTAAKRLWRRRREPMCISSSTSLKTRWTLVPASW